MEQSYDHESVKELLTWAQDALNKKSYPAGKYQINKATTVLDCKKYLTSMISMIGKNWENPSFYSTIDQFREFRRKLEGN